MTLPYEGVGAPEFLGRDVSCVWEMYAAEQHKLGGPGVQGFSFDTLLSSSSQLNNGVPVLSYGS